MEKKVGSIVIDFYFVPGEGEVQREPHVVPNAERILRSIAHAMHMGSEVGEVVVNLPFHAVGEEWFDRYRIVWHTEPAEGEDNTA